MPNEFEISAEAKKHLDMANKRRMQSAEAIGRFDRALVKQIKALILKDEVPETYLPLGVLAKIVDRNPATVRNGLKQAYEEAGIKFKSAQKPKDPHGRTLYSLVAVHEFFKDRMPGRKAGSKGLPGRGVSDDTATMIIALHSAGIDKKTIAKRLKVSITNIEQVAQAA